MPQPVSLSIDVSDVEQAIAFYTDALNCELKQRYSDDWVVIAIGGLDIHLQLKQPGSIGAADQARTYARHWTPVHLDFGVADVKAALAQVERCGGIVEQFIPGQNADIAHCVDPFGHGFCLIRESI